MLCTGAFPNTSPPVFRITRTVWKTISPAPPLGYHAPWRKWFTRMLCMEKLALEGTTPGKKKNGQRKVSLCRNVVLGLLLKFFRMRNALSGRNAGREDGGG